jgi:DNA-binding NarL/FixJ family response regulator
MQQTTAIIMDGHSVMCDGLSAQLSDLTDIEVVGTSTSITDLERLVELTRPDVVVIDHEIIAADRSIFLIRRQNDAPAIVLLGREFDREVAMRWLRSGISAFVFKDSPIDDLAMAIRAAAAKEMWISPALFAAVLDVEAQQDMESSVESRLTELSTRELEILQMLAEGVELREMAYRLGIALNTVRTHTRNIHLRLNVHSNIAAVSLLLESQLTP